MGLSGNMVLRNSSRLTSWQKGLNLICRTRGFYLLLWYCLGFPLAFRRVNDPGEFTSFVASLNQFLFEFVI